jgi:hypothetical protein
MAALVSTFLRGRSVDEALALTGVKPLAAMVSAFARALPFAAVPTYAFDGGLHRAARRILCEYGGSQEHRPHRCCQNGTR